MSLFNQTWYFIVTTTDGPQMISVQARTSRSAWKRSRIAASILLETLGKTKIELKH